MAIFGRRKSALAVPPPRDPADGRGRGVDHGAIGSVVAAAIDGTLPVKAACDRAAKLGASGAATKQQFQQLSTEWFLRCTLRPAAAWSAARILCAGAEAAWTERHDSEDGAVFAGVCADLVAAATAGLERAGDIRLFVTARSAAERGIEAAAQLRLRSIRSALLERLGRMVLTCYAVRRSSANQAADFRAWERKALSRGDPELQRIYAARADDADEADDSLARYRWPDALEAVDLAERYLRESLPLVDRERRGQVLKAISQALESRPILGGAADPGELIAVCEQALEELPPDDILNRLSVLRTRALARRSSGLPGPGGSGLDAESEALVGRLENDWDAFLAACVPLQAWDAVTQAAALLSDTDPARASRLFARHRDVISLWADDSRRRDHWQLEVQFVAEQHATGWVSKLWESDEQFTVTASRVLALAQNPDVLAGTEPTTPQAAAAELAGEALAGALTNVMLASTGFDREDVGLQALEALQQRGGPDWDAHADAYRNLGAELRIGEGSNREFRGDADAAIGLFLEAATRYLDMESSSAVVDSLNYVRHVIAKGGTLTGLPDVTQWCAEHALRTELLSPEAGPQALQPVADLSLAYQLQHGTSREEICLLMAVVTGRRFASLLASGTTGYAPDPGVVRLLAEVAAAEQRLPAGHPLLGVPDWDNALDRDLLVTAYASEFETSPSLTPEDDVVNLQRAAERRMMAQLAAPNEAADLPVRLADIRAALDSRTVVLLLREGMWTDCQGVVYCLLVTDDDAFPAATPLESPWGVFSPPAIGRTVQIPASGVYVAGIRRAVQEEPAPDDISAEGRQLLEAVGTRYARPVFEHLAELRAAGRDRLLIVPHRASHFLPAHLAGSPGHLLADDWTVTYLANLAQLRPKRTSGPPAEAQLPRREGAAVFALGYADQPDLPTLDSSAAEASAIASILGVQPVLDGAATERAFTGALESRRYVHLRAHGRHNVDAPLFQTVFLAPGDGGDGRLRAHEVLGLDLRGLELVTLGACETALGRIDYSDNLRGLPAALLLAGAGAVIGTLWEVTADASTTFFTELYRCLQAGDEDLIGAFRLAQRATRADHTEYRDWGAFYLTGGYQRSNDPG
jgi:CHAT domain-containing protein